MAAGAAIGLSTGGGAVLQEASHQMLAELEEFAGLTSAEQRYIRRSLDVAFARADAVENWARGAEEAASILRQSQAYRLIDEIKVLVPEKVEPNDVTSLLPLLISISAHDLQQGKLTSFAAYRFLYVRLIGAAVRPWLVGAFCAAATMPAVHPELRLELVQSLALHDLAGAGWTSREAVFFPEWVDKVPLPVL